MPLKIKFKIVSSLISVETTYDRTQDRLTVSDIQGLDGSSSGASGFVQALEKAIEKEGTFLKWYKEGLSLRASLTESERLHRFEALFSALKLSDVDYWSLFEAEEVRLYLRDERFWHGKLTDLQISTREFRPVRV